MNGADAAGARPCRPEVDGVEIECLLARYGSPLFILSERTLRENVRGLLSAFDGLWPAVRHAWSYKTNYLGAVCNALHQEGSWAEVVSDFEYSKAIALGVPGSRIIFNGPWKPPAVLDRAVRDGASIHLDHLDELRELEQIAGRSGGQVAVGIRLNFDTGYADLWNRFGFSLESGAAMDAVRRIGASPTLRLSALHSHIGTLVRDVRAYAVQARIMAEFMEAAESAIGCTIEYLDIGGGFASHGALRGRDAKPDQAAPSFEQYAEAIVGALSEATRGRTAAGKRLPRLVLETGRAVVDDAQILVTRVVGGKRLPDGRRAVILDAGINLLVTAGSYNHEIMPVRPLDGAAEETVLYGPLCMHTDVICASLMLPPLSVGDALVINPAGAYTTSQWMQFIQYRPAVVMVTRDGTAEPVRLAENLETMIDLERVPESLRLPVPGGPPDRPA